MVFERHSTSTCTKDDSEEYMGNTAAAIAESLIMCMETVAKHFGVRSGNRDRG